MADTYAVVDKSKKIKNRSLPEERNAEYPESYSNMALYAMVEKSNFDSEPENQLQSGTPQANVNNVQSSGISETSASTTTASNEKSKGPNAEPKPKRMVCCLLVLTIAAILLALISLACVGVLFYEISKLETATSNPQQGMTSSISPINGSLSQLADQLSLINASHLKFQEIVSNGSQEQLNIIKNVMDTLKNETFSVLNNSFTMLESRIGQLENQTEHLDSQTKQLESQTGQLENRTELLENQTERHFFGIVGHFTNIPASSCAVLPLSSPSGYYWVRSSNGSAVRVYCDVTRSCGNITGGWIRVAELDMTNSSHLCPSSLMENTDSNIRTCVRNTDSGGCSEIQYSTSHIEYSKVCGKVIAYSTDSVDAFGHRNPQTIDINSYVDGVSLTHGDSREHIWTFAAGQNSGDPLTSCKCIHSDATEPPAFVGMDYFCDSAERTERLWDGVGCMGPNNCCTFNTPPWFYRELLQPTTDDIEMRVCRDEDSENEDIQIEVIELFIQ